MKTHSASSAAGCLQAVARSVAQMVKYAKRPQTIPGDEDFQKLFLSVVENSMANSKAIATLYQTQTLTAMVQGESGPLATDMDVLTPESPEPTHGSILLLQGETGTAVQRHFSDGLYHTSTGKVYDYPALFEVNPSRPPLVVYVAPEA